MLGGFASGSVDGGVSAVQCDDDGCGLDGEAEGVVCDADMLLMGMILDVMCLLSGGGGVDWSGVGTSYNWTKWHSECNQCSINRI
jgi:hypothetical protein